MGFLGQRHPGRGADMKPLVVQPGIAFFQVKSRCDDFAIRGIEPAGSILGGFQKAHERVVFFVLAVEREGGGHLGRAFEPDAVGVLIEVIALADGHFGFGVLEALGKRKVAATKGHEAPSLCVERDDILENGLAVVAGAGPEFAFGGIPHGVDKLLRMMGSCLPQGLAGDPVQALEDGDQVDVVFGGLVGQLDHAGFPAFVAGGIAADAALVPAMTFDPFAHALSRGQIFFAAGDFIIGQERQHGPSHVAGVGAGGRAVFQPGMLIEIPPAGDAYGALFPARRPAGRQGQVSALIRVPNASVAIETVVFLGIQKRIGNEFGAAQVAVAHESQQCQRVVIGIGRVAENQVELVVRFDRLVAAQEAGLVQPGLVIGDFVEKEDDILVSINGGFGLPGETEEGVRQVFTCQIDRVFLPFLGQFDVSRRALRRRVRERLSGFARKRIAARAEAEELDAFVAFFAASPEGEGGGAFQIDSGLRHVAPVKDGGFGAREKSSIQEKPAAPVGFIRYEGAFDATAAGVGLLGAVFVHRGNGIFVVGIAHQTAFEEVVAGRNEIGIDIELMVVLIHHLGQIFDGGLRRQANRRVFGENSLG